MKNKQEQNLELKNAELEKELAEKNRDLQIEASLERVRAVAMGMRKLDELLNICQILFEELITLGFSELRNAMINIVNDEKGSFLNYDFNDSTGATVTHFQYNSHPVIERQVKITRSASDAFIEHILTGNELEDFKAFRIKNGEAADPKLENVTALYYYFYSFGIGSVGISTFSALPEEKREVLKRFRNVFDFAYRRYSDVALAETQAREAQIEAALERVRSRTMSMQKSEELAEVIQVVHDQLHQLNFNIDVANFVLNYNERDDFDLWLAVHGQRYATKIHVPYFDHPIFNRFNDAKGKDLYFFTDSFTFEEKNIFFKHFFENTPGIPEERKAVVFGAPGYARSTVFMKNIALVIANYAAIPYSEAENAVFKRFAKVFEQTYTRFLDLQRAEAQAREAQIEAALERVRSRTMGMQRSDELQGAALLLFQQAEALGVSAFACGFNIWDEDRKFATAWMGSVQGLVIPFKTDSSKDIYLPISEAAQRGDDLFVREQGGEELKIHYEYLATIPLFRDVILKTWTDAGVSVPTFQIMHCAYFAQGYLMFISYEPCPEAYDIFKRFAKVFEQTYTRFLDLKKAEEQARESQIEAALERVRSRTMGMQKSEELKEVIQVVYEQFVHLNILIEHTGFIIDYNTKDDMHIWLADKHYTPAEITIPYFDSPHWNSFNEAKEKGINFFANYFTFEEKNKFYQDLFKLIPGVTDETREYYFSCPGLAASTVLIENVGLYIENFSGIPYTDEENNTLMRFGKVFQQTYTRFLDLQKAEAQVREAQIEAALEKVRSRSLAMHHTEELGEVVSVVFDKLHGLDIVMHEEAASIVIFTEGTKDLILWNAIPDQLYSKSFHIPYYNTAVISTLLDAKSNGADFFERNYTPEEKDHFWKWAFKHSDYKNIPATRKAHILERKYFACSIAYTKNSAILVSSYDGKLLSEKESEILKRFARVFEQAYVRFLDLQKAEAQAKEAKIEAALERVRARAMSMHHSQDINAAVLVVFEELEKLDLEILRCGIGIIDKENQVGDVWTTVKLDGKSSIQVSGKEPMNIHPLLQGTYDAWLNKTDFSYELKSDDLVAYYRAVAGTNFTLPESHSLTDEDQGAKQYYYTPTFKTGNLYAFKESPFPDDAKAIMRRFASVLNLTFSRFIDLQKAEAQARESQIQLGLERVRAAAMAMHNSKDVGNATSLVFSELYKLGITTIRCGVCIFDGPAQQMEVWSASSSADGMMNMGAGKLNMKAHPLWLYLLDAWRQKKSSFSYELAGKELTDYYNAIKNAAGYQVSESDNPGEFFEINQYCNCYLFNEGCLFTFTQAPFSPEANQVLEKFASVFGLTYRRYLDLTKAEAQAREAQIEAALERVRSRTMAMHDSRGVADTSATMFQELVKLGVEPTVRCGVSIINSLNDLEVWTASLKNDGSITLNYGHLDMTAHPLFMHVFTEWQRKESSTTYELIGDAVRSYFQALNDAPGYPFQYPMDALPEKWGINAFFFREGCLFAFTSEPLSPEMSQVFKRFAGVFGQTYTRFLDLQKAEAQAREAKIEAGLERVRAKAMAMQTSEELNGLIGTVFGELTKLDFVLTRCLIMIFDPETKDCRWWMANSETPADPMNYLVQYHKHPANTAYLKAWKERVLKWRYTLKGKVKKTWDDFLFVDTELSLLPGSVIAGMKAPEQVLLSASFNNFGCLTLVSLEPLSDEHFDIMLRFAKVFDMSYTRFNDLKQAEAQAREAKIQLALERVRARTMAMQHSGELAETAEVLFQQFYGLGVTPQRIFIGTINDETHLIDFWGTEQGGNQMSPMFTANADATFSFKQIYKAWRAKKKVHTVILKGKDLDEHVAYSRRELNMPMQPELIQKQRILYNAFFSKGLLMIVTPEIQSDETLGILERFAGVFDGTYTRFLDLQQAEAQIREAKIEAALERVRSRTMAMFHSDELAETASVMFQQFEALGIAPDRIFIGVVIEGAREMEMWATEQGGNQISKRFKVRVDESTIFTKMYNAWKEQRKSLTLVQQGEELATYIHFLRDVMGVPIKQDPLQKCILNIAFFSKGLIGVPTQDEQPPEMISLVERFAGVFNLTYTRFLDLQKAEGQAREAQIETSLERVRSKAMAMRSSEDLADAIGVFYHELGLLSATPRRCGLGLIDKETRLVELSTMNTIDQGNSIEIIGELKLAGHPVLEGIYDNWLLQKEYHPVLRGNDIKAYYQVIQSQISYPDYPDDAVQYGYYFFFRDGGIFAWTETELPEAEVQIYRRFNSVISLTYRRYKDIREAEAQAREAQIEAALEKVRGKALAMYNSKDLSFTASLVFTELRKLGINPLRCGVGLLRKDSRKALLYSATTSVGSDALALIGWVELSGHRVLTKIYDTWLSNENYFPVLNGKQLQSYYKKLLSGLSLPSVPDWQTGDKQYGHFFHFTEGCLYAWSEKPYAEPEIKILQRFSSVIDLTFRRYIELQKSEAQAREAVKQASLDRVRAEIASMRTRGDLERITPLIWDELTILGIPFIRCGVFIMDEEQRLIHTFLSTPDGKAIGAFHIPFDTSGNFENMVDSWRRGIPYIDHWREKAFSQFADTLVKQGAIAKKAQYMATLPKDGVHLNFLPFLQGMLYVGNTEPLTQDNINLVQAVAEAFSTAYARYEDFNKLELAKQEVERTLSDLKAAQTRLVQSEKMASLGELTAGIAHEIQNPLNFVNNFSEVNQEMIDELEEELHAGNIEEALAIAADIKQNEQKINHHGKRADGIVKGMLQHSRSGGGEKVPTNINSVAEEYMRLSYHGLRAKDKSFNAEMVMNLDPELPRVEAVGQDIGRVFLNLFNNAFYAVNQKKKKAGADYKPEVSVTTLTENGQVIIKVKDNGLGMPDHVKEKIMQPFFTTKPTGEGTGLGLSLTYDMVVKGHGGSIQVNSVEGEGSEFIISIPVS